MKKFKGALFYLTIIGGFSVAIYWIILLGAKLELGRNVVIPINDKTSWHNFSEIIVSNLAHPLALLLAQIVTIILVARVAGWICMKMKQPAVIGEMLAGIVLGPSLIGMYWPEFSATLFPTQSMGNLKLLSQVGLILFMFIVGMELDMKILRNRAHDAIVISHASIIFPFAMGLGLAFFIYQEFAPMGVQFMSFGLFMGIAMSITAFPVLARIVQERGIQKTKLGTIVITCAAADDITAWCILAAVIAIVKAGSFTSSIYTILMALAYVALMTQVVRPFLKRIGELYATKEKMSKPIVAIFFLTLIISSYLTEVIGIHALFGAFMAGAIMPESTRFRTMFSEKVEDVALVLLLPLFFVFTGLRTEIGLLNDIHLWKICGVIVLVAVVGKFLGSTIAAKFVGQNWKDSLSIGALMNTRGLMELVVLNIGYDLKVLDAKLFSMMVIMALVTTFMTGPALDFINFLFRGKKDDEVPNEIKAISKYKILLSFGSPASGRNLFRLANSLTKKLNGNAALTAMHISNTSELYNYDMEEQERQSFKEIIEESSTLDQPITTLFKASTDIDHEITNVANKGKYDLLMVGIGESIYEGSLLGKVLGFTTRIINPEKLLNTVTGKENIFENSPFDDRTQQIIARSQIPVGIFIEKGFTHANRVFIPIFDIKDNYLVTYAQKLIHNSGSQVVILDATGSIKNHAETKEKIRSIEQTAPNHITLQSQNNVDKEFLQQQDLMLISLESWRKLIESKSAWLSNAPSTLILSGEK